jgi:hypothetical protein
MSAIARQEKIIFGEMRASGVRGLLIYCSDYKCSQGPQSVVTDSRMTSSYPTQAAIRVPGVPTPRRRLLRELA